MSDNLGRTGWLFLIDGPVCKPSCSISGLQCECWWCEGRRFCLGFQPGPQCPSSSPQVRTSVYAHMHRCAQFGAECGSLWLEVSGTGGMGSDRVWCAQKGGGVFPCAQVHGIVSCDVHVSYRAAIFKHRKVPDCGWSGGFFGQSLRCLHGHPNPSSGDVFLRSLISETFVEGLTTFVTAAIASSWPC